jgi:hypothetical protein
MIRATGHAIRSNCAAVRLVTASIVVANNSPSQMWTAFLWTERKKRKYCACESKELKKIVVLQVSFKNNNYENYKYLCSIYGWNRLL